MFQLKNKSLQHTMKIQNKEKAMKSNSRLWIFFYVVYYISVKSLLIHRKILELYVNIY